MQKRSGFVILPFIIAACVIVGVGALIVTKQNDSPVEQAAEAILKTETGIDVDFSPNSLPVD